MANKWEGSLGEYLFTSFKAQPRDNVFHINGVTGESQSVQEALTRSVALAAGLRRLGLQPEDVVAIVSNYSNNSISAVLGSIFHGAAPFPMDPTMKQLELQHMFKLAKPKVVFVISNKLKEASRALDAIRVKVPIYLLDGDNSEDPKDPSCARVFDAVLDLDADVESYSCTPIERPSEQTVVVVQSSGTTGLPKGVASSHKAYLLHLQVWEEFIPGDSCLQLTPLFWVSGFQTLLFSLVLGYERIYMTEGNPESIIRAVSKYKTNWTVIAPIYMARILNCPILEKYDLSSLKRGIIGGSSVPHSTINLTKKKLPHLTLNQAYGATEISGLVTIPICDDDVFSAGRPLPMHDVKVVDVHTRKEMETYKEGEIVVKSPTLMKYYLAYEGTLHAVDERGYYHTGDVGYFDHRGLIFITSRIKELIKVKNHQVSPAELEDVIRGLSGVADVAVVGIPHEIDQYHPRALVVKEPGASLTERQIVQEVADKLSDSKQLFAGAQFVDSIPRNQSGKIKRGELSKLVKL